MVDDAKIFAQLREDRHLDSYPRPFLDALMGYINDEVYPPFQRDSAAEAEIRQLLPRLGVADLSFEPIEFLPGP